MVTCLLVETKDKRKFFTLRKNYKNLVEYCKTFNAKMYIVKAEIDKVKVLDLPKLVPALCDKTYKNEKVDFEILETKKIK